MNAISLKTYPKTSEEISSLDILKMGNSFQLPGNIESYFLPGPGGVDRKWAPGPRNNSDKELTGRLREGAW